MNILIVEDDPIMGDLLLRSLSGFGDRIFHALSMDDAELEMAKIPPPDLILLDLVLPPLSSRETLSRLERLRKPNPRALVVVLTGSMEDKIEQASLASGADAFLHKNDLHQQSDLLEKINIAIQGRIDSDKPLFESAMELFQKIGDQLEKKRAQVA